MPQDVDEILSIPLSANRARDGLVWVETKKGKFSVRSAYKMAQEGLWVERRAESNLNMIPNVYHQCVSPGRLRFVS